MLTIAFGHRKGVGKDTCAKFLMNDLRIRTKGKSIEQVGFADVLKDITYKLYAWAGVKPRKYYDEHRAERDVVLPRIGVSVRQLWIRVGMALRDVYELTWIDYVMNSVKADIILITDLRFPNEVSRLREYDNTHLVLVENPRVEKTDDEADCALDGFSGWDHGIMNDGSMQDLFNKMSAFATNHIIGGLHG